ncbi:MAG: carbohydrate ABC transporter permease [Ornithinimicrobium sp.]
MSTTTPTAPPPSTQSPRSSSTDLRGPARRKITFTRVLLYVFLTSMAILWLFPVLWALYNSFRDYAYTAANGYVSFGGFTTGNYTDAWSRGDFSQLFLNSAIITIPAVVFTLVFSTMAAFVLSRFSYWFNLPLLILFTAANLLPQQSLLIPLFRFFREVNLLDNYLSVILVHIAFQTGFCTFVLSNFMKALPHSLTEAALVDGATVWRQYWQIILPLCRPPLAALTVLQVTWIYNDFFWAVAFLNSGDKFPITSGLQNLRGQFFTDYNLLSAGSIMVAVPTIVVFFLLQKQFVSGLTLGADKG